MFGFPGQSVSFTHRGVWERVFVPREAMIETRNQKRVNHQPDNHKQHEQPKPSLNRDNPINNSLLLRAANLRPGKRGRVRRKRMNRMSVFRRLARVRTSAISPRRRDPDRKIRELMSCEKLERNSLHRKIGKREAILRNFSGLGSRASKTLEPRPGVCAEEIFPLIFFDKFLVKFFRQIFFATF